MSQNFLDVGAEIGGLLWIGYLGMVLLCSESALGYYSDMRSIINLLRSAEYRGKTRKTLVFAAILIALTPLCVFMFSLVMSGQLHDCKTGENYTDCVEEYFFQLAEARGTVYSLAEATTAYKTDAGFRAGCHNAMHAIGRHAATEFSDATDAFGHGTFLCWSGYYHGVVEGVLRTSGEEVIRKETLNTLCGPNNLLPLGSFARFHCTHALGHAIMYRTSNDLPLALTHCSSLIIDADKQRCALGAFMENYLADGKEHKSSWQTKEDLSFPCTVTDKAFAEPCFFVQGMFVMKQFNADKIKSLNFCSSLLEKEIGFQCVAGVGKVIADIAVFDHEITRKECTNLPSELQEGCFFGALQEIVGVDASMAAGEAVCSSLLGEEFSECSNALRSVGTTLGL